jgi:hypothetical protein
MENERKIQLINKDVEDEFGVHIEYAKARCGCGNSWGIRLLGKEDGISVRDLSCERCMAEKYIQSLEKEN